MILTVNALDTSCKTRIPYSKYGKESN
jgi:hypothetical protein